MDNGQRMALEKEKELKFGKMAPNSLGTGKTIWQMVKVDWYMLMVIITRDSGKMTKHKAMVYISISIVHRMKVNGKMISNKDMGLKLQLMGRDTKETLNLVENMELARWYGEMARFIVVSSMITKYKGREPILGKMAEFSLGSGKIIWWKAEAPSCLVMAEDMKATIRKTKKMDMESSTGQMDERIRVNGKMENNTEKDCI